MKITRYWDPAAKAARYGVIEGDRVREIAGLPYNGIKTTRTVHDLNAVRLLAACEPTKIVAGGANYHGHLKEVGLPVPETPVFFLKPPSALAGPGEAVVYPPESKRLEYEGELAVVVKERMHRTPPGEVLGKLLGY
ncbi:MAG TPA: fumarylacetoacetate hydrolase family protein, partial [bacterium]